MKAEKTTVTDDRDMIISRVFKAPRELVWKMWTESEHIKHWWGPTGFTSTTSKMEVKPGGVWELVMHGPDGRDYKNEYLFREVVKPEKLVMEHVSPPWHLKTVYFISLGNKTQIDITMRFETAQVKAMTIKEFKADEGLRQNMDKLETYLSQTDAVMSNPQSPFVIERIYNASSEKVWKAITDKEEMKKWYFDLKEFKPEVGFEFSFIGGRPGGIQYVHKCRITEVIPGKKLAHTWCYEGYEDVSYLTFELFAEGSKTRVRLTHAGLETFPQSNPDLAAHNFAEGWTSIIGSSLPKYLENE
jgi:uncharacterized protein YndB with AHSA1/START domain